MCVQSLNIVESKLLQLQTSGPLINGYLPWLCKLQKGCIQLAAASDKVYQLHAHGRWFSPGTPASSNTKTGRHDIAEILLKVALNTINQSINPIWILATSQIIIVTYYRFHFSEDSPPSCYSTTNGATFKRKYMPINVGRNMVLNLVNKLLLWFANSFFLLKDNLLKCWHKIK
jgi:hypothetical protein